LRIIRYSGQPNPQMELADMSADPIADFRNAIAQAGLSPPQHIEPGKLHRFPSNGRAGDDAGWCKLFADMQGGVFGDHRTDLKGEWHASRDKPYTREEREAFRRKCEAERAKREAEEAQRHTQAAKKAQALWKAATETRADHPYLVRKSVKPVETLREITSERVVKILGYSPSAKGEALTGRLLVAPLKIGAKLATAELIDESGRKHFLAGGAKGGGFWAAQALPPGNGEDLALCIGEGVATVLSGREATGYVVLAALDCGNLPAVARAMRKRYPKGDIVLLSDLGNGQKDAEEAARTVGGICVVPDFTLEEIAAWKASHGDKEPTDWNDMAVIRGLEAVREIIIEALARGPEPAQEARSAPGAGEDTPEPWGDPILLPNALPPVEPFVEELLPEALRPWVTDISERMQCPPDFPAVAVMVCLGAVVGRQMGIRPKRYDDWLVVPNLWGAVVGRPSIMKSPAIAEPIKMLERLEIDARKEWESELRAFAARQLLAEASLKQAKQSIAKALKAGRDATQIAAEAVGDGEEEEPRRRRYITNDSTVEKLGELLRDNPRGILTFRDELVGLLQSLDREGRESSRAFYLEGWNGAGRFTFDRIVRGTVEIEAACISVLGGIQPGPLSTYLAQALGNGAGDDGLLQRHQLLVWPDSPREWRNVDRWPDTEAKRAAWAIHQRLDSLDAAALGAQQGEDDPIPWLRFTPEAQKEFNAWRTALEARLRTDELPPAVESHLAKYRSLVPSLALLSHLADYPEGGPVGHDALLRACAWAEYLESHARRLYAQALSPDVAAAIELDRHLGDLPEPFTARDVYLKGWHLLDQAGTAGALAVLADLNRIRGSKTDGPGRPTMLYRVNPALRRYSS
jgi:putative DNA primase/helicase